MIKRRDEADGGASTAGGVRGQTRREHGHDAASRQSIGRRRCRLPHSDRRPESDGTFEWDSTTLVSVGAHADGSDRALATRTRTRAAARLIHDRSPHVVIERSIAFDIDAALGGA